MCSRLPVWKLHKAFLKKKKKNSLLRGTGSKENCLAQSNRLPDMAKNGSPAVQRCQKTSSKGCVTIENRKDALEGKWRYQESCAAVL